MGPGESIAVPERAAIAQERITRGPDGLVRIGLKRPFSDGTVAVDLDPLSLLSRLAASVPPPRLHKEDDGDDDGDQPPPPFSHRRGLHGRPPSRPTNDPQERGRFSWRR